MQHETFVKQFVCIYIFVTLGKHVVKSLENVKNTNDCSRFTFISTKTYTYKYRWSDDFDTQHNNLCENQNDAIIFANATPSVINNELRSVLGMQKSLKINTKKWSQ